MKLDHPLMQQSCREDQQQKQPQNYRLHLHNEVVQLQAELDGQEKLNRLLQCALHGPLRSTSHLSSSALPLVGKVLLAELAVVEEEILLLERKVGKLKKHVHRQHHITNKWEVKIQQMQNEKSVNFRCFSYLDYKKELTRFNIIRDRKKPSSSHTSVPLDETRIADMVEWSRMLESQSLNQRQFRSKMRPHSHRPNDLSEQLIKCLT